MLITEAFPNLCKKEVEEFMTNMSKRDMEMHQEINETFSPEKMLHSENFSAAKNLSSTHQISHKFSLALNAFESEKTRLITQRHATEVRSFRSRRQSAFPLIRK